MTPWKLILLAYAAVSAVTFVAYGVDKRAAVRGRRRVPEATLHLLELLGGFPGALVAQQVFRHKRNKAGYMIVCRLIIALHLGGWGAWLWLTRR